ncbi:MAG: hypothetical protein RMK30_09465 [Anaerolineae bacterium]|nr:hypothetical protein [Anaerolineae bacterium]MDW8103092.1 hypothetical protein [Anaerolineae bacterium]
MGCLYGKLMAGGFFFLAVLFYFLRESKWKAYLYPVAISFASVGLAISSLYGNLPQILGASLSLAIILGKREGFGFQSLALAGATVLFFFSPGPVYFLSAWLLVDLFLLVGWGSSRSFPGHFFSQGLGILAFVGWEQTGFQPLLLLSASARAGFFPWPRSSFGSRFSFLPMVMAFYLLKAASSPEGLWFWMFALWFALGNGFELAGKESFPQALWGVTISLVLFREWGIVLVLVAFILAALKESLIALWNRGTGLFQWLEKGLRSAGEFIEGEGGWLWIGLGFAILFRGLGSEWSGVQQRFFWRELFPEGFGLMSASLYILVTESELSLLFALLAQYIAMAFYKTSPFSDNWLIAARVLLGAMVCFILYFSRWGARWIHPPDGSGRSRKEGSWWLLRVALGVGGGFLAFATVRRYAFLSPVPEERLVSFWVTLMGFLGALAPGFVLQKAAGVLTFINGLELAGLVPRPAVWFLHLLVAMVASFLSAYEKAKSR